MSICRLAAVSACLAACLTGAAAGQIQVERFERQLEQLRRETRLRARPEVPAAQRALIDFGGSVNFSFMAIDDIDQSTHILRQTSLIGYAEVNIDGVHQFFARGRTTYDDFNDGDAFDSHGDDWVEPTLDRAHYRLDLARAVEAYDGRPATFGLVVQGGRQLVYWASGLTLSTTIDGGVVSLSSGPLHLDVVGGITRDSVLDFDSSRPGFSSDTQRGFYGGMLGFQVTPRHRPFVYGLVQDDQNDDDRLVIDGVTTRHSYESYYIGAGSTGSFGDRLAYSLELVYEGGEGLSNSMDPETGGQLVQTDEDIEAFAADARIDYLLTDANHSRLSGEVVIATGDSDRANASTTLGGNRSGTSDHGFNAFGLINTGLAFNPAVSNLVIVRLGASTFPIPGRSRLGRLQVGSNLFIYGKLNESGPIDEDTFADPSDDKTYLGVETDLFAIWQLTSDLAFTVRYGVFFPGTAIGTDHDSRHFFQSGVTLAF